MLKRWAYVIEARHSLLRLRQRSHYDVSLQRFVLDFRFYFSLQLANEVVDKLGCENLVCTSISYSNTFYALLLTFQLVPVACLETVTTSSVLNTTTLCPCASI